MDILDLLRSDGSIIVNKSLSHQIGLHEAVILSELISRLKWHQEKGEDKNGWFYCTHETLKKQTSLSRYYQDKAIDNLVDLGLIDKKTTGVPAKRHFYINEKTIIKAVTGQIVKGSQTRMSTVRNQDCKPFADKNVKGSQEVIQNNNTKNNTKDNTSGGYKEKYPPKSKLDSCLLYTSPSPRD